MHILRELRGRTPSGNSFDSSEYSGYRRIVVDCDETNGCNCDQVLGWSGCCGFLVVPVAHLDTSPRVRCLNRGFADLSLRVDERRRNLCEQRCWLLAEAA